MSRNGNAPSRINESVVNELRELQAKMMEDVCLTRREEATMARQAPTPAHGNRLAHMPDSTLVFSVLDDIKLYGGNNLDSEFDSRNYDPYQLYKEHLRVATQTEPQVAARRETA